MRHKAQRALGGQLAEWCCSPLLSSTTNSTGAVWTPCLSPRLCVLDLMRQQNQRYIALHERDLSSCLLPSALNCIRLAIVCCAWQHTCPINAVILHLLLKCFVKKQLQYAQMYTSCRQSHPYIWVLLQVCLTGSIQEDNCAADSQACWSNDTMHVDACVDTYRGYVCKCPEGDCVDTYAYAVVVTLRLHLP